MIIQPVRERFSSVWGCRLPASALSCTDDVEALRFAVDEPGRGDRGVDAIRPSVRSLWGFDLRSVARADSGDGMSDDVPDAAVCRLGHFLDNLAHLRVAGERNDLGMTHQRGQIAGRHSTYDFRVRQNRLHIRIALQSFDHREQIRILHYERLHGRELCLPGGCAVG